VQWVSAVAERCGAPFVILEKTRRGDRGVSVTSPDGAWNGHTPVVIDDIVSTGRTMIEATRQLRAAGSAPPMCVAIHAVFADALADALLGAGARGIVTWPGPSTATADNARRHRVRGTLRAHRPDRHGSRAARQDRSLRGPPSSGTPAMTGRFAAVTATTG